MFSFFTSCAQKDSTIYFKEIGWTIKLPSDLKINDSVNVSANHEQGQKIVEDETQHKIDLSKTKNLMNASKDALNWFNLSYNSSEGITNKNWKESDSIYYDLIIKTIIKKLPGKVDTTTSVIKYDGIEFVKYQASFKISDNASLTTCHLATFHNGHTIIIGYAYTDRAIGDEIVNILKTSKFTTVE